MVEAQRFARHRLETNALEKAGNPGGVLSFGEPSISNGWRGKTILKWHECAGTLDASDLNGDGEVSVLDIDEALRRKGIG